MSLNQKRSLVGFICCISLLGLKAQEERVPLAGNPLLQQQVQKTEFNLKKSGSSLFPLVEYFLDSLKPNGTVWQDSAVDIKNRYAIFNAIDQNGNPYSGSGGIADQLTSEVIDLSSSVGEVFVAFTLTVGDTYTPGDSMVVEGFTANQTWVQLLNTATSVPKQKEYLFYLDPKLFKGSSFQLRFTLFTTTGSLNTASFLLSKLTVANSLPIGWYDNLLKNNAGDQSNIFSFAGPDVRVINGSAIPSQWGNALVMDVRDASGALYRNGDGTYGGMDTLYSHALNLSNFATNDSIFLGFSLKGLSTIRSGDSLLVDYKNNLGAWVRAFNFTAASNGDWQNITTFINIGRNRHAGFRFRFILKTYANASDSSKWLLSGFRIIRRNSLPFIDDFSSSTIYSNRLKWQDSLTYINNDFPVGHPSINVATFDGLNQYGNAYSPFPLKGICDIMTSRSFNLIGIKPSDSLILSFYCEYEAQGTTNQVFPDDSLYVEFRNSRYSIDSFVIAAKISPASLALGKFTRMNIAVTDPSLFHDDFQFRFKNRGSLSGNLSQWHIDYVKLDKGRTSNDAAYDVALSTTPTIRMRQYSSMPIRQYTAKTAQFGNDSFSLRIVNLDQLPHSADYFRYVNDNLGNQLDFYNNIQPTIFPRTDTIVRASKSFTFSGNSAKDSIVFRTKYQIGIGGGQNDDVTSNDSISLPTIFSNYMAYDDGTAEGGYGVKNKLNAAVALKYTIPLPDTLYGMYVFFNQSEQNVSTQHYSIKVWKKISPLFDVAQDDQVLYSKEISGPVYTGKINGFAAFQFETPIPVTDSFYVGWDQVSAFVLNVGLDKNYPYGLNTNMFYKADARWYPTEIPGALMVRPIVGKWLNLASGLTNVLPSQKMDAVVYPNPSNEFIVVQTQSDQILISLSDLQGRTLLEQKGGEKRLDVSMLPEGMYIVRLTDMLTGASSIKKIIIQH